MGFPAVKLLFSKPKLGSYERHELNGFLPEPMFLWALCLERKRAERSRKLFVLMLLDSRNPFPNGNGRHARLMADLLIMQFGAERFTWGSANLQDAGEVRKRYIESLKAADGHDLGPLLAFARS